MAQTVEPMQRAHVEPSAQFADRVVRYDESFPEVSDALVGVIRTRLSEAPV